VLKAKVRELEAGSAASARAVSDTVQLLQRHATLVKAIEEKGLELSMRNLSFKNAEEAEREALHTRIQLHALAETNECLTNELDVIKLKLHEAKARSNDTQHSQGLVDELLAENTNLKEKLTQLAQKYDQATAMHYTSMETVKKMTEATQFVRAKNENNEHEIEDLRAKVAAAETDRDWYV
jgi:hypothetical protein